MTTFTKEQLQQIEAAAKEVLWPVVWSEKKARAHFSKKITPEVVLELARIALLSLCTDTRAQPVSEPKAEGDFLSRLKAEHVELEDRCIKLANFIDINPAFKNLAPRMQRLLESQAAAMVDYASILERRIYLIEDAAAPAQEQK